MKDILIEIVMRCNVPMPTRYALQFAALATLGIGCTKGDKVPAYVEIPSVELTTTPLQGAPTARITDVWVSVNEELIGVWELPARVPVLKEGEATVTVVPAIKRNGMYDDRLRYPFFTSSNTTVQLVKNQSVSLSPSVSYIPQAQFWIEAFEDPGTLLDASPASDTTLLRFTPQEHPDLVLDGSPCGGFVLEGDRNYIRLFTDQDFEVFGGPVFLELDYRADMLFTVGVLYAQNGIPRADPYIFIVPTGSTIGAATWNKIYIDVSPVFNSGVTQRDIYIEGDLPSGVEQGTVLFDNIKLVRILS